MRNNAVDPNPDAHDKEDRMRMCVVVGINVEDL